jgi:hypothetical protein
MQVTMKVTTVVLEASGYRTTMKLHDRPLDLAMVLRDFSQVTGPKKLTIEVEEKVL